VGDFIMDDQGFSPIAVVGISCIFPGATEMQSKAFGKTFWMEKI
jgi:hypothetical protein